MLCAQSVYLVVCAHGVKVSEALMLTGTTLICSVISAVSGLFLCISICRTFLRPSLKPIRRDLHLLPRVAWDQLQLTQTTVASLLLDCKLLGAWSAALCLQEKVFLSSAPDLDR